MNWLPKGERPKEWGDFWVREERPLGDGYVQGSSWRPCLVRNLAGSEWVVLWPGDASPHLLTDQYFDHCRFAPATPPPDWDLELALAVELGFNDEWPRGALRIVRAWLAGEPGP